MVFQGQFEGSHSCLFGRLCFDDGTKGPFTKHRGCVKSKKRVNTLHPETRLKINVPLEKTNCNMDNHPMLVRCLEHQPHKRKCVRGELILKT